MIHGQDVAIMRDLEREVVTLRARCEAVEARYDGLSRAWTEQAKDDKEAQERIVAKLQAGHEGLHATSSGAGWSDAGTGPAHRGGRR